MSKLLSVILCYLSVLTISSSALAAKTTFYGKPATWLFDLIQNPTSKRNFDLISDGQKIGCTQVTLDQVIQCTIHGTTTTYPTMSSESQRALCS